MNKKLKYSMELIDSYLKKYKLTSSMTSQKESEINNPTKTKGQMCRLDVLGLKESILPK